MNLKSLTQSDLSFLLEIRNHPTTRVNLENNSIFTLEECNNWFNLTNPVWYIIEVDNEKVGYLRTNKDEIGCDIHPNYRRKGYARQAYKIYLQNKTYASLWVFEDNFAKNLYEELGFIITGDEKIIRKRKYIKMEYKNENRN